MPDTTPPSVLFVCVHNAGRSQMAAAFLTHLAGDRVQVRSAGSAPADEVNPSVVAAMAEVGIDLSAETPKILTVEAVQASDVVITMGCGDTCPVFPGKRYLDWQLTDPAGQGIAAVRPIRDEIERHIRTLVQELSPPPRMRIVAMSPDHAEEILAIYQLGIDEGNATFETTAPTWTDFNASKLPDHRHVAIDETGKVLGWIAAIRVSDRQAYAGVVEHSLYVHPTARAQGIGAALLRQLITSTEAAGIWTIQSGIFPENTASLALHQKSGFRIIGTRERIAQHHGAWRNVTLIERRSPTIT